MRFPAPAPETARRYRALGHWRDETIPALVSEAAARVRDKIAVRDASGGAISYGALLDRAARLGGYLASVGIGRGDIVTVCLPNRWEAIAVFLAVLQRGAVLNPVPTTYGRADLAFVVEKCRSKALVAPGRFRSIDFTKVFSTENDALARVPLIRVGGGARDVGTSFETACAHESIEPLAGTVADDPAAVLFTSGTESRPKGVVHSHNTILFGERSFASALHIDGDDVAFMASPISHATGFLHGFVMTLMLGGTLSLLDVFSGPAATAQMRGDRCTWTMGATPFLADCADDLDATGTTLPDLRYFLCGGAPVPETLVRRATGMGLRILSIYGSTESPPHTVVHPGDPVANAWLSDGRPLAGIEVGIVGPDRQPLPLGEIGEARSRGPNTFLGYLDEPGLTAKDVDADGWYYSGDLARILPDGSLRIAGRLKDVIVRGGQNISAREVEDYLLSHPAVAIAAIVGIPHARFGETGCAVVVLNPGATLTLAELVGFLEAKGIARFKLPEQLAVWSSLPMTPSGKIQKFVIRKQLAEQGVEPAR